MRRVLRYLDDNPGETGWDLAAGIEIERHRAGPLLVDPGVDPDDVAGVCSRCQRPLVPSTWEGEGPWEDDLGNAVCSGDPHVRVP